MSPAGDGGGAPGGPAPDRAAAAGPAAGEPWTPLRLIAWTQGYFARGGVDTLFFEES